MLLRSYSDSVCAFSTDTIKTVSSDDLEMAMTATTTDSSESNSRSNLIKDAAKTHHIAMGGKTEDENDLHIDMDETPDQRDKATHAENEEDVVTLEEEDIVTLDDCAFDDAKEDVVDGVDGVTTEELHHPDNSGVLDCSLLSAITISFAVPFNPLLFPPLQ